MSNQALEGWALPRLQQLLPIDDDSLKQIIQYAGTLPKDAAAEHLKNLLGDDGKSLEFISSFNLRRQNAPVSSASAQPTNHDRQAPNASSSSDVPRGGGGMGGRGGRGGKKRANIHALPARQVEDHGNVAGAYRKRDEDADYMPHASSSRARQQTHKDTVADNLALRARPPPDATQMPLITDDASATSKPITSKPPPSAAGSLISDSLAPRSKSRTSSPAPTKSQSSNKTKVHLTGGTAMHGASTALSDLDRAIQSLEIQTNPSLTPSAAEDAARQCPCMATRHPLLDIAPNCLACGQIICVKQGLGPCTFCGTPLLTGDEISKVLRVLKDERGEAKMAANNAAHRKADVALGKPRAFTGRDFLAQTKSASASPLSSAPSSDDDEGGGGGGGAAAAKAHRDRLLTFQAHNARRTQVHDEAADYDVPTSGTNMWASPAERAMQLKRQQKVLREVEWNARPEWEKRRVVASIDLKGGRVVRKMAEVERPEEKEEEVVEKEEDGGVDVGEKGRRGGGSGMGGAFSRNPLAKGLIRPTWTGGDGEKVESRKEREEKSTTWRRVQMDEDDNEAWILDGGVYGGREGVVDARLGEEEHAFG